MQQFKQKIMQLITQFRRSKKGFTLIEVVAVMAIIGVLAVALVPSIEAAMDKSTDTKIISKLVMVDGAAKVYKLERGSYPESTKVLIDNNYIPSGTYEGVKKAAFTINTETGIVTTTGTHGELSSKMQELKQES